MNIVQQRIETRRQVVLKMYVENVKVSDIAEGLGISQQTVYKDLRELGLREKGEYAPFHKEAISRGVRRKMAVEKVMQAGAVFCCVCGKAGNNRFKQKDYCDIHLETAGNHDPEYMNKKRAAMGQRFTSHGRVE